MLEDKILELLNFGWKIDDIVKYCLVVYNKNPYDIWNYRLLTFDDMKKLVIDVILKHS